jgi:quinol monooxygenase YgiN
MQVMIRCKVRPDGVEAGLELLQEVYEEMRSVWPKGLRYATFQLEDKVTFVSFAEMDEGPEVLQRLEAFQRHRATPTRSSMSPPCSRCCTKSAPTAFTDAAQPHDQANPPTLRDALASRP